MIKLVLAFFAALPDLIKLLAAVQKSIDEAKIDRKVSDDLKVIHGAFNAKNADELNALFNSR